MFISDRLYRNETFISSPVLFHTQKKQLTQTVQVKTDVVQIKQLAAPSFLHEGAND